jgi:hypothetical protein
MEQWRCGADMPYTEIWTLMHPKDRYFKVQGSKGSIQRENLEIFLTLEVSYVSTREHDLWVRESFEKKLTLCNIELCYEYFTPQCDQSRASQVDNRDALSAANGDIKTV